MSAGIFDYSVAGASAWFLYFARDWRKLNGLEHYRVKCNFGVDVTHSMPQEEGLRSAEVQAERMKTLWNTTVDFHARLQKQPI
jgi:hypothetical protein